MQSFRPIKVQIAKLLSKHFQLFLSHINGTESAPVTYFGPIIVSHANGFEETVTDLDTFCKVHKLQKDLLLLIVDNETCYNGFTAKRAQP